jgi:hypothetical protein
VEPVSMADSFDRRNGQRRPDYALSVHPATTCRARELAPAFRRVAGAFAAVAGVPNDHLREEINRRNSFPASSRA